jgi:hypothetical protein
MVKLSVLLVHVSDFLAARKGLLPLVGLLLIVTNLVFQIIPAGWLSTSHFFLHLGLIVAILGLMLARAL